MSFCTSCGNNVAGSAKFCEKCGKPVSAAPAASGAAAAAAPAPAQAAPQKGGGGALKVVLVILGVIVLLAVIAIAGLVGFGYWVAKNAKVQQGPNGSAKIETPFGKIETEEPADVANKMGIQVYPGAEPVKNGGGGVSFGSFSVGAAEFETSDSVEQVAQFYKQQYPSALHTENNGGHVFNIKKGEKNVVINIMQQGSKTTINLAKVVAPNTSQ